MKRLTNSALILVLSTFLLSTGCATTTLNQDGTVQFNDVDYSSIQLMSSATVAAWAASQKDGIKKTDAQAVVKFLDILEEYRKDGTAIDIAEWTKAIQAEVPVRYQPLAMVMVQLVDLQLKKYGVSATIPKPGGVTLKIMEAIRSGAMLALSPYLDSKA
jgi:hypothetical protein